MTEAKHTPGPWNVRSEREYDRAGYRLIGSNIGPDGDYIRRDGEMLNGGVWVAETKGPDCIANARLIAAAPDLLEALRLLVEVDDGQADVDADQFRARLQIARAAIAKATDPALQAEQRP